MGAHAGIRLAAATGFPGNVIEEARAISEQVAGATFTCRAGVTEHLHVHSCAGLGPESHGDSVDTDSFAHALALFTADRTLTQMLFNGVIENAASR